MSKLKYLAFSKSCYNAYHKDTIKHHIAIDDNPSSYISVPDGEYHIRGEKKNHAKYYHVYNNIWYLMKNKTKDNGHYLCDAGTYLLYPNLSEKEWELLNKVDYKKLAPVWRRYRYGYNHFMELRELGRGIRKQFLKYKKDDNR